MWELLTWQNLREFCVNVTDSCHLPPCHLRGMDLCHMTRQEIEALLKMLAEMEREELELLIQEARVSGSGGCIDNQTPAMCRGFCLRRVRTNSNSSHSE